MMSFKEHIYLLYFKYLYLNQLSWKRKSLIQALQKRGKANVLFFVSNVAMWRAQKVFDLLNRDEHFSVSVFLYPFSSFEKEQRLQAIHTLRDYFSERQLPFYDGTQIEDPAAFIKKEIRPDIVFYPQQYMNLYGNGLDSELYDDLLLCYIPYALIVFDQGWLYNQRYNNVAWRLYFPSQLHKDNAEHLAINKGRNVRLVGEASADAYLDEDHSNPWKERQSRKKRIIWAPHFSIGKDGLLHRGSFLDLHALMLKLATQYAEHIQIAFKPHPRLLTELYNHPDWGKEKADAYYRKWAEMPNTQLETGEYIDLFMNSDAMIHDCGSFTAEYLYTLRPVMFYTHDRKAVEKQLNELGMAALDAHYIGGSADDIESFIKDVVIGENDPKVSARKAVYDKYLLPPNGRSTAENIYHDLLSSLGFEK